MLGATLTCMTMFGGKLSKKSRSSDGSSVTCCSFEEGSSHCVWCVRCGVKGIGDLGGKCTTFTLLVSMKEVEGMLQLLTTACVGYGWLYPTISVRNWETLAASMTLSSAFAWVGFGNLLRTTGTPRVGLKTTPRRGWVWLIRVPAISELLLFARPTKIKKRYPMNTHSAINVFLSPKLQK